MAANATLLRTFAFNMSSDSESPTPTLPPPRTPLITAASTTATAVTIAWRGAAGGCMYMLQGAAGSAGPWQLLVKAVTDDDAPVKVALPSSGPPRFVRAMAVNCDGVLGTASAPVAVTGSSVVANS